MNDIEELKNITLEYIDNDEETLNDILNICNENIHDIIFMQKYYKFLAKVCTRRLHKKEYIQRIENIILHTYENIDVSQDEYSQIYEELIKIINIFYKTVEYGNNINYDILTIFEHEIFERVKRKEIVKLPNFIYAISSIRIEGLSPEERKDYEETIRIKRISEFRDEYINKIYFPLRQYFYKNKISYGDIHIVTELTSKEKCLEFLRKYNFNEHFENFQSFYETINNITPEDLRSSDRDGFYNYVCNLEKCISIYSDLLTLLISFIFPFIEILRKHSLCNFMFPFLNCNVLNYFLISKNILDKSKENLFIITYSSYLNLIQFQCERSLREDAFCIFQLLIMFENIDIHILNRIVFYYIVHNDIYLKNTYYENLVDLNEYNKLIKENEQKNELNEEIVYYDRKFIDDIVTKFYNDITKDSTLINKILTCAPDNILTQMIYDDDIEAFITHITKYNIDKHSEIMWSAFNTPNLKLMSRYYETNMYTDSYFVSHLNKIRNYKYLCEYFVCITICNYAAFCGSLKIFKYTFERGDKFSKLINAIHGNNYELIEYILDKVTDLDFSKDMIDYVMIEAKKCNHKDVIEYLNRFFDI